MWPKLLAISPIQFLVLRIFALKKCTDGLANLRSQKTKQLQQPKLKSFVPSNRSFSPTTITRRKISLSIFFFLFNFLSDSRDPNASFSIHLLNDFSYTKEALEVSAKLLEINPESYTAWNYRKLAVQHNLSHSNSDTDSVKSILDEELRVVIRYINNNNF